MISLGRWLCQMAVPSIRYGSAAKFSMVERVRLADQCCYGAQRLFGWLFREVVVEQGFVFQSGCSQVVLLPNAVALPDGVKRVDVIAIGRTRILTPVGESWDGWFDGVGVTADFMAHRSQLEKQEREEL